MNRERTKRVIDETGAVHELTKRIGVGGQGEVWLVKGGRRIVKLLGRRRDAERHRRQFAFVRRLDLRGVHVAKPLAVLRAPDVGYVAEFLADMVPIASLMEAPASELLPWHIAGGGLRRRLRLLAHAGEALMGLHARAVIYADVSHNNVFVSQKSTVDEAWLIDLDNLSHDSDPAQAIYTPGYGAPEVVGRRAGCTSLSDAWSFAVLVYRALTLQHPFVGDIVDEGEPELQERALAGELPWVGCETDRSNACSTGFPPELVLGRRLQELARRTFEGGLREPKVRPGVADWVERLHVAADLTVLCRECGGSYFVTEPECPWCDEPPPEVVPVRLERWRPGVGLVPGATRAGKLPLTGDGLTIARRLSLGRSGLEGREPHVTLSLVPKGIRARVAEGREAWVAPLRAALEKQVPITERGGILPRNGWVVFFENPERPQRVAVLGRDGRGSSA